MSDRICVSILCRKEDADRFDEDFGLSETIEDSALPAHLVRLQDSESSIVVPDDLPPDVPFIGCYDSGPEHPGGVFACDGSDKDGCKAWCSSLKPDDDLPGVSLNFDGELDARELRDAREYLAVRYRACEALGVDPRKKPYAPMPAVVIDKRADGKYVVCQAISDEGHKQLGDRPDLRFVEPGRHWWYLMDDPDRTKLVLFPTPYATQFGWDGDTAAAQGDTRLKDDPKLAPLIAACAYLDSIAGKKLILDPGYFTER